MKYSITIELLSDLCSSNGSTDGRMIDTDICFDYRNKPYIPAKRLKGVLLQAYLDYIDITGEKDISETLFGEEDGEKEVMYISDALLSTNDETNVTYYRTQICIDENGTTKDGSLRTLMVVKRNVKFEFTLELNSNFIDFNTLNKILSLVTHIGLNRNRGFGEVKLQAKEIKNSNVSNDFKNLDDSKTYKYEILCKTVNDLLLPEENSEISGSVIPGSSIYGFFAYHYINKKGLDNPMNDNNFVDIFYNDGVKFSFGFISDEEGNTYYQLPSCVQKGKNTETPLYRLTLEREEVNDTEVRVKYKSLNSKFGILNLDNKSLKLKDVNFRFNYHHQRDKDEMGKGLVKDTNFFQYKAILAGQYFKFSLEGKGKYLKDLLMDLECLHVGKSRTAQYGTLKIDWKHSCCKEVSNNFVNKSKYYLACVESPIILNNTNFDDEVENLDLEMFMYTLHKNYPNFKVNNQCYSLSRKLISGFNMLWKKSKPSMYGIAPGSYVLLENECDENILSIISIGKKCNEGFGEIKIVPINEKNIKLNIESKQVDNKPDSSFDLGLQAKTNAISELSNNKQLENFDSGLLSRMLLMLRQTNNYKEFKENITGIKDENKKKNAQKLLDNFENTYGILNKDIVYKPYFFTLLTLIKYEQRKQKVKDEN